MVPRNKMFSSVRVSCFKENPSLRYKIEKTPTAAQVLAAVSSITNVRTCVCSHSRQDPSAVSVATECGQIMTLVAKYTYYYRVRVRRAVRTSSQGL